MKIPFIDLYAQYQSIKEEIDLAIAATIKDSAFIKSPSVDAFEAEFGNYLDVEHTVSCGNGTDAIEILLSAMNIKSGDEVLVPAVSWISTSEAIVANGAKPVFVDIDSDTYTLDHKRIEEKITKHTKAIIPVHLYGHPASMLEIMSLAKKHNLWVIEDCAQAHGAEINGQKVGTFGNAATFSFFPTKNLGAFGDAGAMVTGDEDLAGTARALANHGQKQRHVHELDGRNSRMDGLQAAILSVKLKYLDRWTALRIEKAALYESLFQDIPFIQRPSALSGYKHVYHLYVVQVKRRDAFMSYLAKNGVASMVHYPTALPFQKVYSHQNNSAADYPVARRCQDSLISIPLYPELSDRNIQEIAQVISNFK